MTLVEDGAVTEEGLAAAVAEIERKLISPRIPSLGQAEM